MKYIFRIYAFPVVLMVMLTGASQAGTITTRRLVEVADLGPPMISPDGRKVAFRLEQASIERNTYDTVWYVQNLDGFLPPRRLSDGGVPLRDSSGTTLPASAVWSPDGRWIYYRALVNGKIDIWRAATDGSDVGPITSDSADVRDFSLLDNGKTLVYSVGATRKEVVEAEKNEYENGIRIDESVPIGQPLYRSGFVDGRLATQRFGALWFDRVPLRGTVPNRWKSIDLRTGKRRDLIPPYRPSIRPSASELDPWAIAIATDPSSERVAILRRVAEQSDNAEIELIVLLNRHTKQRIKCKDVLCSGKSITSIQWRPNSDEVIFAITDPHEGLAQSYFLWDIQDGSVKFITRSKGLLNGGRTRTSVCGISYEALACVASEADKPPRLERVDLLTGNRQVLFDPNAELAKDMAVSAPSRLLRWKDSKGREFTGQYFAPRRTSNTLPPLFITYYFCTGFLRGGVGDEWPLAPFAEQGIASLCINQPTRKIADRIEAYEQAREAIEEIVNILASGGEIDRTKVGMGGLSFGSAVTMWMATNSDLLKAASVTSPVVSPNYYLLGSMKGELFKKGLRDIWDLGAPDETPGRWKQLSPVFNLSKVKAPILMQMPEQEYIHALDYAIPLIRMHLADLYVFPNEPHQKFQPRHKLAAYQRNLNWFAFWLQGYEISSQGESEDKNYWRQMKTLRPN